MSPSIVEIQIGRTMKVALENAVQFAVKAADGAASMWSPAGQVFVHSWTQVGATEQLQTVSRGASYEILSKIFGTMIAAG